MGSPKQVQGPENASVSAVQQTRGRVVGCGCRVTQGPDSLGLLRQWAELGTWS